MHGFVLQRSIKLESAVAAVKYTRTQLRSNHEPFFLWRTPMFFYDATIVSYSAAAPEVIFKFTSTPLKRKN